MVYLRRVLGAIALVLTACGGAAAPPTTGTLTDFSAVCAEENRGKRVAVDGFLRLPDSFSGDLSVVLRLFPELDATTPPIGVQTRFGDLSNQVEMVPDQYTDEDLKVHLTEEEDIAFGTKARVSGTVYFPSSTATVEFVCGLENPLFEKAP